MFNILSIIISLIISSCILSTNSNTDNKNRSFSHLNKKSYKISHKKIISPLESRYIVSNQNKKYRLSKRTYVNDNIGYKIDLNNQSNSNGYYKVGKPYKIMGITYHPQEYDNYEEVGEASWYGSEFHGKKTANGEIYNMGDFTAAHRTLPLPSIVEVTNLENGRKLVVRVNDRGPFANNRIIDLSKEAAEALGFKDKGLTNVKIKLLKQQTSEVLSAMNSK